MAMEEAGSMDDEPSRREAALDKVQQTKIDVRRCELALSNAESASAQRWVLAPVDGTVTAANAQIGQSVEPGSRGAVLFEITPRGNTTGSGDRRMPRRE